jgi:two-component system NtrC family sensor kinase
MLKARPLTAFLVLWLAVSSLPQELKFQITTTDGQPARVVVNNETLGSTGEVLTLDITRYRRPVRFDVVLTREGSIPSMHRLKPNLGQQVWKPPPLAVYSAFRQVDLRIEPPPEFLFVESKDGALTPAGQQQLYLEVKDLTDGRFFVPRPVVVVARRAGYLGKRIQAPPEIWDANVFPPADQESLRFDPAPGLAAWWTRTKAEHPVTFVVVLSLALATFGLFRMRLRYLKQVEAAHAQLNRWVERLNTFVDGSQAVASQVSAQDLGEQAQIQAKRLTRADRVLISFQEPAFQTDAADFTDEELQAVLEATRRLQSPLRLGQLKNSPFESLSRHATSLLVAPLVSKGQWRGAVICLSEAADAFSEVDEEALQVLAFQLAGGIERVALYAETVAAYKRLAESEAQLVQSAKMASIGQLAAGVAHELNTPLNAIGIGVEKGRALMLKSPEKAKKRLELAARATAKAEAIVAKLLYYSEDARLDGQLFDLKRVVEDTLEFLNFQLEQDGISVIWDDSSSVQVVGNLNELHQVLNNLILNARDAILKGECHKEILIELGTQDTDAYISVADRGPGIDEAHQDKIFDPFFTTKNMGDGTGLGLSVSQKIMEKHEGTLTWTREQDQTVFTMRLAAAASEPSKR